MQLASWYLGSELREVDSGVVKANGGVVLKDEWRGFCTVQPSQ